MWFLAVLLILGAIGALWGYLANIVKLFTKEEGLLTKGFRVIGIFVPIVGIIAGCF